MSRIAGLGAIAKGFYHPIGQLSSVNEELFTACETQWLFFIYLFGLGFLELTFKRYFGTSIAFL